VAKNLAAELGLKKSMPLPAKYQPKVTVRVTCGRTKQVGEFTVELPIEGQNEEVLLAASEKLRDLFAVLGIYGTPKEKINAQGNLRPEESQAG
jgi:hypothetical protein